MRIRLPTLLTLVLSAAALHAAPVLRIDFNDAADSNTDTAASFSAYSLADETLPLPPYSVTVNPAGGASLDDIHRAAPADSPALSLAPVFRDSIFVEPDGGGDFYRIGVDAVITGLTPGKRYQATVWSFDSGSTGTRTSDWSALGMGGPSFGANNYAFNGGTLPAADTANQITFSALATADGTLTLRGRQSGTATTAQVFLNGLVLEELPDPPVGFSPVLAVDFNDRSAASTTAAEFQAFLLSGSEGSTPTATTRSFGEMSVAVSAVGQGVVVDDRLRTTPVDADVFTGSLLLRDFVFASGTTGGMDVRVQGLEPNGTYLLELWSYDTGSATLRTSDWTVNGTDLWDDYQFNGSYLPATNDDYKMSGVIAANAAGELVISGRVVGATTPAVFLNALRVSAVGSAQVIDLGGPVLSEFVADNDSGITDEDGDASDWMEIWNATPEPLDLTGWHLTDNPELLTRWTFPAGVILAPNARIVVWASGKNRLSNPGALHTNFALSRSSGAYLALVRPDGATVATEYRDLPSQRTDYSYGLTGTSLPLTSGYFQGVTPGAPNGSVFAGFVADTQFSPKRGLFSAPFHAKITSATAGAVIRYTTDGSEPTESSAVYPGGAGIPISGTTVVRARAYAPPMAPTNVDTHTYIFPAQVAEQPANPPGWPLTWDIDSEVNGADGAGNGTVPSDYAMDPRVVDNPVAGYEVPAALTALPTMSIALSPSDFLGAANGIYSHPRSVGDGWERAASVEIIERDGSSFQERTGIRVHGNSSRRPLRMQKHSFRLAFRDEYGAGKLNYRLFPSTRLDSFDKIVLRASFTDSWGLVSWDPSRYRPDDSVLFRDIWMKESHAAMGYPATANRLMHLYVNGLYWGIYNPCERIDDVFCADHFGGLETDWDIIADFNELKAGNRTAWNSMFSLASAGLANQANYNTLLEQFDPVAFADYYLLHVHAGAEDWPSHNWYAIRNRNAPGAKWQWFVWDQEIVLDNLSMNRIGATNANTPGALLQALRQNAEFRLLFADRAQRHLFNNGALSLAASQDRWQAIANELDKAIVAESARWGDTASTTPYGNTPSKPLYTREADWLPTVNSVRDSYLPALYNESLSTATIRKLRAANLFPATAAPSFAQHGGNVPHGYELAITAPAGSIYYTLDGSDPREAITGSPRGTLYSGAIPLTVTGTVKARARNGSDWSALAEARFIVGVAANATNLAIAELHYHPASDEALEFVELVNRSGETIDLTGVSFAAGITFTFPDNLQLAPGARILVVRDLVAFKAHYGSDWPIAGQYSGALDNNGEEIALVAADGSDIFRFRYEDSRPWPAAPDDQGRSLIFPSLSADPTDPSNWRSSVAVGGSPGTIDSVAFSGDANEDADGDGLTALLEHAFGTSDSDPDSGAVPLVQLEEFITEQGLQQFLTLTAPRNLAADDALLRAEFSTTLTAWQSGPTAVVFVEERIGADGKATLKWRAAQPAANGGPPQFLRVRANHVP